MEIYSLFGHILEPPGASLSDQINECISILTPLRYEAADRMSRFKAFVEQTPFRRIEKIYDDTFSLEGICYPYVGYQLLGDGSHRRLFLDGLMELYQIHGFSPAQEAPDHLGVMLRFLAEGEDEDEDEEEEEEEVNDMASLYIIPSLRRMLEGCEERATPYEEVLQALLLVLRERPTTRKERMAPEAQEEFLSGK